MASLEIRWSRSPNPQKEPQHGECPRRKAHCIRAKENRAFPRGLLREHRKAWGLSWSYGAQGSWYYPGAMFPEERKEVSDLFAERNIIVIVRHIGLIMKEIESA